ncbi:hypothetical protein D4R86_00405 [bacterium]|nr:MAG: hypothetical protein D4R86_00405 [bacterium]
MAEQITPITELNAYVGAGKQIVVKRADLPKVMDKIVENYGLDEIYNFKELLKKALIIELRSLPPSKQYALNNYVTGKTKSKPLREEIIDAIEKGFAEAKRFQKNSLDDFNLKITIRHPLAVALNDGTGLFNKDNPHLITPVNKEYMFIPGVQYAKKYFMRKYKSQGKTKFEAEQLFKYHSNRMTHKKAINQYEKYSAIGPGKFK